MVTPNLYLGFRVNKTKDSVYSRSGNVSGYTKSRVKYTLIESAEFIYIIRIKSVSWEYSCDEGGERGIRKVTHLDESVRYFAFFS